MRRIGRRTHEYRLVNKVIYSINNTTSFNLLDNQKLIVCLTFNNKGNDKTNIKSRVDKNPSVAREIRIILE